MFAVLLPFFYFFADKLKARQHVIDRRAVTLGNLICKTRSNYCLYDSAVLRQSTHLFVTVKNIVHKHCAYLIAVEEHKLAPVVSYRNTHSVAVRVCAYDYIASQLICKIDTHLERVWLFGIGHNDGRKLRIWIFLLFYYRHVYTHPCKHSRHWHISRAVYRRIDYLDIFAYFLYSLFRQRQLGDRVVILLVKAIANNCNMLAQCKVVFALYIFVTGRLDVFLRQSEIRSFLNKFDHSCSSLGRHLRSVLSVYFISVVLLWIVTCSDHNTCDTIQFSHGKRAHRHGAYVFKQRHLDSVCAQNSCRRQCKFKRHTPRVVRNNNASFRFGAAKRIYVIAQALGCPCDSIFVHIGDTHTNRTSHSRRTKRQRQRKSLFDFFFVGRYC